MKAQPGQWLVIEPAHLGEHRRRGLVLDARGADGGPPYLVRWADTGHETLFVPGEGAHVVAAEDIEKYVTG